MRESIFFSSIRAFFVTLFAICGIGVAFILIALLFDEIDTKTTDLKLNTYYTQEVAPNAENVRKAESKTAPVVLLVNIKGAIGTEYFSMDTVKQQLIESHEGALKNNRVKAVLLAINSPGGTVTDSDGIYRLLKAYKEQYQVPVYAYVDGLCASGAMYIAAAADKIYASEVSLIGSVGVVSPPFFNFSETMTKIGVSALTLSAGKGKDALNPTRAWKPGEEENLQNIISQYYNQFVDIVTKNRPKMDKSKLVDDYGAHVYIATEALQHGFIDVSGASYGQALKDLLKQISIEDDFYQVVTLETKNWIKDLFREEFPLLKGTIKHQLVLGPETDPKLANQFLYLYKP